MILMHRREFVRYAGFAGLFGLGTIPGAFAAAIKPGPNSALIVVDVQNCFVDGARCRSRAARRSCR
jgi:nicotinamidase/pyrazinamidase